MRKLELKPTSRNREPFKKLEVYDHLRRIHRDVAALAKRVDPEDTVLVHAVETVGNVLYLVEGVAAREDR